jgi:hypothetical protein
MHLSGAFRETRMARSSLIGEEGGEEEVVENLGVAPTRTTRAETCPRIDRNRNTKYQAVSRGYW